MEYDSPFLATASTGYSSIYPMKPRPLSADKERQLKSKLKAMGVQEEEEKVNTPSYERKEDVHAPEDDDASDGTVVRSNEVVSKLCCSSFDSI